MINSETLIDKIYNEKPSLQSFAMNFTKDFEDANDLVQDTFLKAINYSKLFKEGTNLRAWLYTIMRNTFINDYRRNTKKNSIIETSEDLSSYQLYKSASENQAEDKFTAEDINKALFQLSPEYYMPFIKYFEGYKYHEIAADSGIPIGTVKTRIHVARKLLKKSLKNYNEEYKKSNKYN